MDDALGTVLAVFCVGLLGLIGGCIGGTKGANKQAVILGHAEYYFDKDHDKQFRWLTNCNHTARTN